MYPREIHEMIIAFALCDICVRRCLSWFFLFLRKNVPFIWKLRFFRQICILVRYISQAENNKAVSYGIQED